MEHFLTVVMRARSLQSTIWMWIPHLFLYFLVLMSYEWGHQSHCPLPTTGCRSLLDLSWIGGTQSFGWCLLYKTHLISPILFVTFLSLMLIRRLLSACSVINPTKSPFMVLHAPLDIINQIFSQSTFAMTFPLISSILHYLRSTGMMWTSLPSVQIWTIASIFAHPWDCGRPKQPSKSFTGNCGLVMTRNYRISMYAAHSPIPRSLSLWMMSRPSVWWLEISRRSSRLFTLMRSQRQWTTLSSLAGKQ